MKRIVVTGATSFIGVHLIDKLLHNRMDVIAVVRPNSKNADRLPSHDNLKLIELDIKDMDLISDKITGNIDVFYHLAWEGARAPSRDNKELQEINFHGAVGAMKAAIKLNTKLFIGSGSQAEYGKFNGKVDENYPCNPITEYGKAKYRAYLELKKLGEKNNIRFIWTRIFSVFGKFDFSGTLIMSSIDKMNKNETIQMTACVQNWDFIYVEDVANALVSFIDATCENGVYNIASGNAKMLREFVEELKILLNSSSNIEYGKIPYGKEGPVSFEPIVLKMEEALNWKAETSFAEGVKKLIMHM